MNEDGSDVPPVPGVPRAVGEGVMGWLAADRAQLDPEASADGLAKTDTIMLDFRREIALYLGLPEGQKEAVAKRLSALWGYRKDPKALDVTKVAKLADTGRANVYRLMQRMSEVGPIRGLVPQFRAAGRASGTRDGFGDPWDDWIDDALGSDVEMSIADVGRHLARMALTHEDAATLKPPSATALKRRVQRLRRESSKPKTRRPLLGRLLIDSCRVDIAVEFPPGRPWWITAVIDLDTGIVCGLGLHDGEGETGILEALADLRRRISEMAVQVAVAERLDEVEWVVPPAMAARAENAGTGLPASRRPRIDLFQGGERRSGVRLLRLIGDGLGPYRLRTRRTAPKSIASGEGLFISSGEASYALETAVTERNGKILTELPQLGARGREASLRNAEAVCADLVTLVSTAMERSS